MAQPILYDVPPAPVEDTPEEALHRLLGTLHESGTLRLLDGLLGQFQDVAEVVTKRLDTPEGHNGLSNLLLLLKGLGAVEPDVVETVAEGLGKGFRAANDSFRRDPPGLLALFGALKHQDTRRALHALLVLLQAVGGHLHANQSQLPVKSS